MLSDYITITEKEKRIGGKRKPSYSCFPKVLINIANIYGPAMYRLLLNIRICLPFVMQKAGVIPTIITLLFLCYFSIFSSTCLLETGKLISGTKNNFQKRFDYFHLIDSLITDNVFALSSKFCVLINHLLYTILCIITLSKVFIIFFLQKYSIFSTILMLINRDKVQNNNKRDFFYENYDSIFNNESIVVLSASFIIFLVFYIINRFLKQIFVATIFILSLILIGLMSVNLTIYKQHIKHQNIPLFGSDYTYV